MFGEITTLPPSRALYRPEERGGIDVETGDKSGNRRERHVGRLSLDPLEKPGRHRGSVRKFLLRKSGSLS